METLYEQHGTGSFLVSEGNRTRSREQGTVAQDAVAYKPGTVMALVSGEWVRHDGTNTVGGILFQAVDAVDADVEATIVVRDAEVNAALLNWTSDGSDTLTGGQITAGTTALAGLNIHAR